MKKIGAHLSAGGGVDLVPEKAFQIGATAFSFFTKNHRRWKSKPLDPERVQKFRDECERLGFSSSSILPHASYLINIGHPVESSRDQSFDAFVEELNRCEQLGIEMLNIHPGSHLGQVTEEECCSIVADSINRALAQTSSACVVVENTAGQGSSIGWKFEHLAWIISGVEDKSRVGICLDTCHLHGSGYEIRNKRGYNRTMDSFDEIVGLSYLKGVHVNDAKVEFGSRVDRHQSLGIGNLGLAPFRFLMRDERLDHLPFILETIDPELWPEEIQTLKRMVKNKVSSNA